MTDTFTPRAELADLHRRMLVLETLFTGAATQAPHPSHLVSLYWDACRHDDFKTESTARHWDRQLFALDTRSLLVMARLTRDPAPWHPILVLLDRYNDAGFDMEACRQHILRCSQDLLNLQGLRKLQPRDLAGNPLRVKSMLAAIRGRGDLNARKAGPRSHH